MFTPQYETINIAQLYATSQTVNQISDMEYPTFFEDTRIYSACFAVQRLGREREDQPQDLSHATC